MLRRSARAAGIGSPGSESCSALPAGVWPEYEAGAVGVGVQADALVSPAQWLAIAVFVGLALLATTRFGAIWRGEERRKQPDYWQRSIPAWIVVGWLMIAALPIVLFVTSRPAPVSPWLVAILGLALLLVAGAIVVAAAVMLTGHPRRAVPPYMRKDRNRS